MIISLYLYKKMLRKLRSERKKLELEWGAIYNSIDKIVDKAVDKKIESIGIKEMIDSNVHASFNTLNQRMNDSFIKSLEAWTEHYASFRLSQRKSGSILFESDFKGIRTKIEELVYEIAINKVDYELKEWLRSETAIDSIVESINRKQLK